MTVYERMTKDGLTLDSEINRLVVLMKAAADWVKLAMTCLENMPCGGVGPSGPTIKELANETSPEDASYYQAQLAWRYLAEAAKSLAGAE